MFRLIFADEYWRLLVNWPSHLLLCGQQNAHAGVKMQRSKSKQSQNWGGSGEGGSPPEGVAASFQAAESGFPSPKGLPLPEIVRNDSLKPFP